MPTCALLAAAAEPILSTWLGRAYAPASVAVLQVMCLGTLLNGLAYVPLTWLHASGEFRTPTLVQLGVLLGFVPVVWALTASGGIPGAAWAWTLRLAADALLLGLLCQRRRRATVTLPHRHSRHPAYNQGAYLRETMLSVLAQDYPALEYIVIDDGSTDETWAVAQAVAAEYPGRVQVFTQTNSGQSATLNRGWGMARARCWAT